jgi:hypothetical protein
MNLKKINHVLSENEAKLESFSFMEGLEYMGTEEGTPNDELGAEFDLDQALAMSIDEEEPDAVDDAIGALMDMLVDADYTEESAEEAVFDAIATLVNDGSIQDTPEADATDAEKAMWISNSIPKVKTRLKALGLEFDETR